MTTESTTDEPARNHSADEKLAELQAEVQRISAELTAAQQQTAALMSMLEEIRNAVISCRQQSGSGWPERRRALHELEERLNTLLEIRSEEIRPPPAQPPSVIERTTKLWRRAIAKAARWKRGNKHPPDHPASPP